MKIKMQVQDKYLGDPWHEVYFINDNMDAFLYAQDLINRFNATLCQGESPRTLISVSILSDENQKQAHQWEKQNLITISNTSGASYDKMKCTVCGVTGKKYGLDPYVIRDTKYKAQIYDNCDTALLQINKLKTKKVKETIK